MKGTDGRIKIPECHVRDIIAIIVDDRASPFGSDVLELAHLWFTRELDILERLAIVFEFDRGDFAFDFFRDVNRVVACPVAVDPDHFRASLKPAEQRAK